LINGDGVPADPAEGIPLLNTAAELSNVKAMRLLARCYENGVSGYGTETQPAIELLERDPVLAKNWMERATMVSEQQRTLENIIATCAANGVPVPEDVHTALGNIGQFRASK
jgi:TPR repeat protein